MIFPGVKNSRFALIGSGKVLCYFAKELIRLGFPKPIIITWFKEKHKRDEKLLENNIYESIL